jgi:hypothetical protein
MLVDGVLIPAGQLVNGTSITLHDAAGVEELEYFHVKLATHDVIMACGAPSETLLNYPGVIDDFGTSAPKTGDRPDESYCASVLCKGRLSTIVVRARRLATPLLGPQKLDRIRTRLQERARAIGL